MRYHPARPIPFVCVCVCARARACSGRPVPLSISLKLTDTPDSAPMPLYQVTDVCPVGSIVDIRGKTNGKGFQGGTKRHGFARGPMTHGSKSHRQPGSIGMSATPARVLPGKKMPGQMGNTMVKARKLKVTHAQPPFCFLPSSPLLSSPHLLNAHPTPAGGSH